MVLEQVKIWGISCEGNRGGTSSKLGETGGEDVLKVGDMKEEDATLLIH